MKQDDIALFDAWSDGDVEAGGDLVGRHYEAVYLFFAGKLPEHVASELTQKTFETMCANADRLRTHTSFSAYLLGIARLTLIEWLGRSTRPRFDPVTQSGLDDASPSITAILRDRRQQSRLVQALRTLPLDDQIVLELQTHEGLGLREMAEVLGIAPNRIATRLATAKRRLRRAAADGSHGDDSLTTLEIYLESLHQELARHMESEPPPVGPPSA